VVGDILPVPHVMPSSKLYWAVNPVTAARTGTVIAVLQVLLTTGAAGAAGKITTLLAALWAQAAGATVFTGKVPQAVDVTYLVRMV